MHGNFYKMPPSKPLLKIEDLDKNIEDIIDKRLKIINERLEKLESITDDLYTSNSEIEKLPFKNKYEIRNDKINKNN